MEQFLVTERCSTIRRLGREALRSKWMLAFAAMLIYYALSLAPYFIRVLPIPQLSVMVLNYAYPLLMSGPLSLGYAIFALNLFRNNEPGAGQILYGFERFGKAFGLTLLIGIFTFLWSLLLFIPGIIAAFRYSQAYYILADNPDIGVLECISRSKVMMRGNKAKLFILQLSFIGWAIIASIPVSIAVSVAMRPHLGAYAAAAYGSPAEFLAQIDFSFGVTLLLFASCAGVFLLEAYLMAAKTAFYEMVAGNLRPGYIQVQATPVETGEPEENSMVNK